ncbi:MAG: N-acetylmuramoyl-L-alanine amidase [Caenispirillum sp.]|nr:N-acetylmuramoyl-L-alanine amidase [Caenispirillum sp.]
MAAWPFPTVTRRMVMLGAAATAALGGVLRPSEAWAAVRASAVRLGNHQEFTRFVLDVSQAIDFSLFTLTEPNRIVLDLPEVEWSFGEENLPPAKGVVSALRWGLFQPGQSRVVLDLVRPATVKQAFLLPPNGQAGWRFVLDLQETTAAQFLAAAGPERRIGSLKTAPEPTGGVQEAALRPAPQPTQPPRDPNRPKVIVLDPGHGGVDPGAIGASGVYEKNITLAAAREFRDILQKSGRFKVVLTRDRDIFLPLRDRFEVARRHDADLFISLHADSIKNPSVRGLSVYTLSEKASDSEAAALAEKENKADIIAGIDLSHESVEVTNILIDLAQRETMNLSSRIAEQLIDELQRDVKLLRQSHRFAGFAVLKAPDVPSILIEMGYLSNADEERLLRQAAYRAKLGKALERTLDGFFSRTQKAYRP